MRTPDYTKREDANIGMILLHSTFDQDVQDALQDIAKTRDLNYDDYTSLYEWVKERMPLNPDIIGTVNDLIWEWHHSVPSCDCEVEFEDEENEEDQMNWEDLTEAEIKLVQAHRLKQFKEYTNDALSH